MTWLLAFLLVFLPALAGAVGNNQINTMPSANSSFMSDLQTFLDEEAADRQGELLGGALVSGGYHGTSGSKVSAAFATVGYTSAGHRVCANDTNCNDTIAIDYGARGCADTDTAWTIISAQSASTLDNFSRVPGSNYFVDCTSTTRPALPADSAWLMDVTISGAAITAVASSGNRVFTGAVTQPANITTNSNATWVFTPYARLDCNAKTIVHAGAIWAGDWQIFTNCAAGLTLSGASPIRAAWWGLAPSATGTTNRLALQAAHDALPSGGEILIPPGTFTVNHGGANTMVVTLSNHNIHYRGAGRDRTSLFMEAGVANYVAYFGPSTTTTQVNGFGLFDLKLDPNFANNVVSAVTQLQDSVNGFTQRRAGIYLSRAFDLVVSGVWFLNFPRQDVFVDASDGSQAGRVVLRGNRSESNVNNPGSNEWDATRFLIRANDSIIDGNVMLGFSTSYFLARTGIQATGARTSITNNTFDKIYRPILSGCANWTEVCRGNTVANNRMTNASVGIVLLSFASGALSSGPGYELSLIQNNTFHSDASTYHLLAADTDVPQGLLIDSTSNLSIRDVIIDGLTIFNNAGFTAGGLSGIGMNFGGTAEVSYGLRISNVVVHNPGYNCVDITSGPTVATSISHVTCINPGIRSGASDAQKAAVRITNLQKALAIESVKVTDTRGTHIATSAVNLAVSAGSAGISVLDPELYFVDGAYTEPLVEVGNANAAPFVRGTVPTFVALGDVVAAGSTVLETSTGFLYINRGVGDAGWCPVVPRGYTVATAADGDTTPTVKGYDAINVNNTSPTSITDFDDGCVGQRLTVICLEANTTIVDGGSLLLAGNLVCSTNDTITLVRRGSSWYEQSRSVN